MHRKRLLSTEQDACSEARARFPAGLDQPEHGFRMSIDALLLAAFAHHILPDTISPLADLGTGTGGCLAALALLRDTFLGTGFEKEEDYRLCAEKNFMKLGVHRRLTTEARDLSSRGELSFFHAHYAACLANPPYYSVPEGRHSGEALRDAAMRQDNPFAVFIDAARILLRHHGHLCLILPPSKIQPVCALLEAHAFGLRTILPVLNFRNEKTLRLLLCARKNASPDTTFEPPLILCTREQSRVVYTEEAERFCPWLRTGRSEHLIS